MADGSLSMQERRRNSKVNERVSLSVGGDM